MAKKNISAVRGIEDFGYAEKRSFSSALRKRNLRTSKNLSVEKKGMELPVNTLVVVAIAVIVILAVAAFFLGSTSPIFKSNQDRTNFLNACSGWSQTGCADSDIPYNLEDSFKKWQPNVDFSDSNNVGNSGLSATDYLKRQCGCFSSGTPNPTGKLCSDYSVSDCPTGATDICKLKYTTCSGLGSGFTCGSSCSGSTASSSYGCTSTTPKCCIPAGKTEPANSCISK